MDNFNECMYNIYCLLNVINFIKKKFVRWIKIVYKYMFLLLFYVSVYVNFDLFRIMILWINRIK